MWRPFAIERGIHIAKRNDRIEPDVLGYREDKLRNRKKIGGCEIGCDTTKRIGGKTEGRGKKCMKERKGEGEKKRDERQGKEIVNAFMYLRAIVIA